MHSSPSRGCILNGGLLLIYREVQCWVNYHYCHSLLTQLCYATHKMPEGKYPPSPKTNHADEAKAAKIECVSLAWGRQTKKNYTVYPLIFWFRAHAFLCLCACMPLHICSNVAACIASCLLVELMILQGFFLGLSTYNLFCLLVVCRAVPVRLPYKAVWLTSQQQTAAAFSQYISYYTAFASHFSAAVG